VIGRSRVQLPAAALSGNDLGQVIVHTNVPLFTKQYNLVPCEGFHVNAPYVAANGMGSMDKGSIVVAVLQRYKLSTLPFFTFYSYTCHCECAHHQYTETLLTDQ